MSNKMPFDIEWEFGLFLFDFINVVLTEMSDTCVIGLFYLVDGFGFAYGDKSDVSGDVGGSGGEGDLFEDFGEIFLDHCFLYLHLAIYYTHIFWLLSIGNTNKKQV